MAVSDYTRDQAQAMTWPDLATAGAQLEGLFAFTEAHTLAFRRIAGARPGWAVEVLTKQRLGYLRRYIIRSGEVRFL